MEHFQPPLTHQLEPAACKLMKGNHFTSSHLSIASELYPQLLTDICYGPLGRSAPCCTPPNSMFTPWNQCLRVITLAALPHHGSPLSRSSIKYPPFDQIWTQEGS